MAILPSAVSSVDASSSPLLPPTKVIIVGAGFSGLSVAYHLHQDPQCRDWQVEIIEARNRVGGRVHTVDIVLDHNNKDRNDSDETRRSWVDLGGQWIHEANPRTNPLCRLIETDLQLGPLQANYPAQRKQGGGRQGHRSSAIFHGVTGQQVPTTLFKDASRYFYKAMDDFEWDHITSKTSFQHLLDEKLQQLLSREGRSKESSLSPKEQQELLLCTWNYCKHRTECYEGGRTEELSVALSELYQNRGGPDKLPPSGGYGRVLQSLVDQMSTTTTTNGCVGARVSFRLNSPVQSIRYDSANATESAPGIQLCLSDGTSIEGDLCVCTLPLGVLKKDQVRFDPPLSECHRNAIDAIGFGILNKIILHFPKKFWGSLDSFGVAHPNDPTRTQSFVDCSINEDGHVLMLFLGGSAARRIDAYDAEDGDFVQSSMTDDEAVADAMTSLKLIFGHHNVPNPIATHVTRWGSDPWARGAYSFAQVGCQERAYDDVAQPIGNLGFAGEHTSKVGHSTVHGAWETGQREAQRVVQEITRTSRMRR